MALPSLSPAKSARARARRASRASPGLDGLRREAASCRRCPLWEHATQTVFGAGDAHAPVVFVGEQPGDQEDLQGEPFVGPAGRMFDRALAEAEVPRERAYVTNAVKHFKFVPRGKRRIHQKPNAGEINACRWWLDQEIELTEPRLIVAMGATAARAVLRRTASIADARGRLIELDGERRALVTVHPSFLLRIPDPDRKAEEYRGFVRDLRMARPFFD